MSSRLTLLLFLLLVMGGGLAIGAATAPGAWYQALQKPWFNPPDWLFGPAWSLLYILIAVAGWRIWRRDRSGAAMTAWWVQLALNFLWSPVFFGARQIGFGLVVVLAMLASVLAFIALVWNRDRVAALLFIPYAGWVAFASLLNASIWWLN
jgi:tryptophan-rich sensory protein